MTLCLESLQLYGSGICPCCVAGCSTVSTELHGNTVSCPAKNGFLKCLHVCKIALIHVSRDSEILLQPARVRLTFKPKQWNSWNATVQYTFLPKSSTPPAESTMRAQVCWLSNTAANVAILVLAIAGNDSWVQGVTYKPRVLAWRLPSKPMATDSTVLTKIVFKQKFQECCSSHWQKKIVGC